MNIRTTTATAVKSTTMTRIGAVVVFLTACTFSPLVDAFAPIFKSRSNNQQWLLTSSTTSLSSSSLDATRVDQTPEQKARRKELLKRDGSFFQLNRSSGRVEFGTSAKLVTRLVDDNDAKIDDQSETIRQWLSDGKGLAMSIWDPDLLTDLGDNVYRMKMMSMQFVSIQLSPTVDVQMWTQKGQNVKTGEYLPVFNLQSVRYDPNVQLFPGMNSVTAESLGIVIEVVGELIPSKDGDGVTGKISFATSGDLPPPLLLLPDQVLKMASDTINDSVAQFAIQSFQSGAIAQYTKFRQDREQQQKQRPSSSSSTAATTTSTS